MMIAENTDGSHRSLHSSLLLRDLSQMQKIPDLYTSLQMLLVLHKVAPVTEKIIWRKTRCVINFDQDKDK